MRQSTSSPDLPCLLRRRMRYTGQMTSPTPVYCNRTLNLRSMRAIGYDMDYTLIHYHHDLWEARAFEHARQRLAEPGWPVDDLVFDRAQSIRGLVVDVELGNLVKANRFGGIKRASHGTSMLSFEEQRAAYSRVFVDLRLPRWTFMDTLFSLSEACLYGQLVDLLDAGQLDGVLGYEDLYRKVRRSLDAAHREGELKAEIAADPDRFVDLDPNLPLALLDQRHAGKKLLLITNSEWSYTRSMMAFAFDRFLPDGQTWRDLFDLIVVEACKPHFFEGDHRAFEVVDDGGLLRPADRGMVEGRVYFGGDARAVEEVLGVDGTQILYVGDHIYSDVHVSKVTQRWRTALVLRELEEEIAALHDFATDQEVLAAGMAEKAEIEGRQAALRLAVQRLDAGYGPPESRPREDLIAELSRHRERLTALDERLAPMAERAGKLSNPRWGLLLRAGGDKSHLARQIERHADIYLARVSDFLALTPYRYLRSSRSSLPHDR